MGLIAAYIFIAAFLLILSGINLAAEYDRRRDLAGPARMVIAAIIWPLMVPVVLWWLICTASEREFPTFEAKQ